MSQKQFRKRIDLFRIRKTLAATKLYSTNMQWYAASDAVLRPWISLLLVILVFKLSLAAPKSLCGKGLLADMESTPVKCCTRHEFSLLFVATERLL